MSHACAAFGALNDARVRVVDNMSVTALIVGVVVDLVSGALTDVVLNIFDITLVRVGDGMFTGVAVNVIGIAAELAQPLSCAATDVLANVWAESVVNIDV